MLILRLLQYIMSMLVYILEAPWQYLENKADIFYPASDTLPQDPSPNAGTAVPVSAAAAAAAANSATAAAEEEEEEEEEEEAGGRTGF